MDSNTLIFTAIGAVAVIYYFRNKDWSMVRRTYKLPDFKNPYRTQLLSLQRAADRGDVKSRVALRTLYGNDFQMTNFS